MIVQPGSDLYLPLSEALTSYYFSDLGVSRSEFGIGILNGLKKGIKRGPKGPNFFLNFIIEFPACLLLKGAGSPRP